MQFLEAMRFAHACRLFDVTKKIPDEQLEQILEAGRLTPSSFGLEHTRLLVVQSQELKAEIKPLCWNQEQITTCSDLVIFTSKVKDIIAPSDYILQSVQRRGLDERYIQRLERFQKENFQSIKEIEAWSIRQAYLMASSMVNCAAFLGIDSCCIEGFEKEKLEEFFKISPQNERIALLVCFGYRVNAQKLKYRIPLKELIKFI